METLLLLGGVLFLFVLTFAWGYTAFVEAASLLTSGHAWLVETRTRWHLARHGLSNDQVVAALLAMDEFTFYMLDRPCVCVKGPDGRHEFVFPREALLTSDAADGDTPTGEERSAVAAATPAPAPGPSATEPCRA